MTLLKQVSDRLDSKGKPFLDYFIGWRHDNRIYWVRVKPSFTKDNKFLAASAINVPTGEPLEKYID